MRSRAERGPRSEHRNVHTDACDGTGCPCYQEGRADGTVRDGQSRGEVAESVLRKLIEADDMYFALWTNGNLTLDGWIDLTEDEVAYMIGLGARLS
jgi:hypothetical protein